MPQPRKSLISLSDTPYYHCISRCVRRAFLCGIDRYSGENYEHRRDWLEKKLHQTAEAFAIKLCAYAVMNNHYHVVLNVRTDISDAWSNLDVVERWHSLFSGNAISQQYASGETLTKPEKELLNKHIDEWRSRLADISWFMRVVNEPIARRANKEDECTGRFWEGRFKSQALLDDKALLSCMAYVDLNPVRAGISNTPENSQFTCVTQRIQALQAKTHCPSSVEEFIGSQEEEIGLPFALADYLELIDWTGKILRSDKICTIDSSIPPILTRLGFERKAWKELGEGFENHFSQWVGNEQMVRAVYRDRKYQRIPSTESCKLLLG